MRVTPLHLTLLVAACGGAAIGLAPAARVSDLAVPQTRSRPDLFRRWPGHGAATVTGRQLQFDSTDLGARLTH